MSHHRLPELMKVGQELLVLLEHGEVEGADQLIDQYLGVLDGVFQHTQPSMVLDMEHQQALLQFQAVHERIANAKRQTEDALLQFSKAGRVSDLYKLNVG